MEEVIWRLMTREEAEGGNWRLETIWEAHDALLKGNVADAIEALEWLLAVPEYNDEDELEDV